MQNPPDPNSSQAGGTLSRIARNQRGARGGRGGLGGGGGGRGRGTNPYIINGAGFHSGENLARRDRAAANQRVRDFVQQWAPNNLHHPMPAGGHGPGPPPPPPSHSPLHIQHHGHDEGDGPHNIWFHDDDNHHPHHPLGHHPAMSGPPGHGRILGVSPATLVGNGVDLDLYNNPRYIDAPVPVYQPPFPPGPSNGPPMWSPWQQANGVPGPSNGWHPDDRDDGGFAGLFGLGDDDDDDGRMGNRRQRGPPRGGGRPPFDYSYHDPPGVIPVMPEAEWEHGSTHSYHRERPAPRGQRW